ncbi:MAG: hypothetical protein U5J95_03330 [Balneolaceae bacterium]|nr:hypothetical protein [Balneolaceae bacterium]
MKSMHAAFTAHATFFVAPKGEVGSNADYRYSAQTTPFADFTTRFEDLGTSYGRPNPTR